MCAHTHTHSLIFSNNEVTSTSWLWPKHKKSIVSITMRKNDGPLHMRWIWCPCPFNPTEPSPRFIVSCSLSNVQFPPPSPASSLTDSVIWSEGKWNLLMQTDLCLYRLSCGGLLSASHMHICCPMQLNAYDILFSHKLFHALLLYWKSLWMCIHKFQLRDFWPL